MILALEQLREKHGSLPFDICIALCCDEEFRHRGVDEFLAWEHRDKVAAVIVGEPTELRLAAACKGSIRFRIETTGDVYKRQILEYLDQKGAFVISKAGEKVADFLSISKYTFYSYLDQVRENKPE